MRCDRVSDLIGVYMDQELDIDARREVAAHLLGCPKCSAVGDDIGRMSRQIAAMGRQPAPGRLTHSVCKVLDSPAADQTTPMRQGAIWQARDWPQRAAVLLLACGATAVAAVAMMSYMASMATLYRDVTAAHVRSLLQESPVQVASSEAHSVKPWFTGRLEFAPSVKDLTAEGFPLAGARLDYIGDRRVAALVYRRRLHVVNVFEWPAMDGAGSAPRDFVHKGYNTVTWIRGGIAYWAISDLNMGELRLLQSQF